MHLSINTRLRLLAGAGVVLCGIMGGAGWFVVNDLSAGLRTATIAGKAIRNHLEADMMHDALRGDVQAALLATTDEARQQVETDLREHAEKFNADVAQNADLPLAAELHAALRSAQDDIRGYIDAAAEMVKLARADRAAAEEHMPEFLKAFGVVEERMEKISDQVEEFAATAAAKSDREARWSLSAIGITAIIAPPLLLLIAALVSRSISRPLHHVTESLTRCATSVIQAADEAATASRTITDGANSQAASLEQTRATAEQLAGAKKGNDGALRRDGSARRRSAARRARRQRRDGQSHHCNE